jgi:hypothetical protein
MTEVHEPRSGSGSPCRFTIRVVGRAMGFVRLQAIVVGVLFCGIAPLRAGSTEAVLEDFGWAPDAAGPPRILVSTTTTGETSTNAPLRPAFRAVPGRSGQTGRTPPLGLVPLFTVETQGRTELRRLPARGQESFSDPVFFAWPPRSESEAGQIAGRWEALAIREDRSRHRFALELAVAADRVSARFDPDTDYRFAHLTEGRWLNRRLDLRVEYLNDRYRLSVERRKDRWMGTWRLDDDSASGPLELWREAPATTAPPRRGVVALHECRMADTPERIYRLADDPLPPGWSRVSPPLCEVWRPAARPGPRPEGSGSSGSFGKR